MGPEIAYIDTKKETIESAFYPPTHPLHIDLTMDAVARTPSKDVTRDATCTSESNEKVMSYIRKQKSNYVKLQLFSFKYYFFTSKLFKFLRNRNAFYFFVGFACERSTLPSKLKKYKYMEGGNKYIMVTAKLILGFPRNIYKFYFPK